MEAVQAQDGLPDRAYQQFCLEQATRENVVVCLPTGAGKTRIAVRLLEHFKHHLGLPDRIAIFLAPSVSLCMQQAQVLQRAGLRTVVLASGAADELTKPPPAPTAATQPDPPTTANVDNGDTLAAAAPEVDADKKKRKLKRWQVLLKANDNDSDASGSVAGTDGGASGMSTDDDAAPGMDVGKRLKAGAVSRQRMQDLIRKHEVFVATPGEMIYCLTHALIQASKIHVLVLDEAHHVSQQDAYAQILKNFVNKLPYAKRPRILGLTATPLQALEREQDLRLGKPVLPDRCSLEIIINGRIIGAQDWSEVTAMVPVPRQVLLGYPKPLPKPHSPKEEMIAQLAEARNMLLRVAELRQLRHLIIQQDQLRVRLGEAADANIIGQLKASGNNVFDYMASMVLAVQASLEEMGLWAGIIVAQHTLFSATDSALAMDLDPDLEIYNSSEEDEENNNNNNSTSNNNNTNYTSPTLSHGASMVSDAGDGPATPGVSSAGNDAAGTGASPGGGLLGGREGSVGPGVSEEGADRGVSVGTPSSVGEAPTANTTPNRRPWRNKEESKWHELHLHQRQQRMKLEKQLCKMVAKEHVKALRDKHGKKLRKGTSQRFCAELEQLAAQQAILKVLTALSDHYTSVTSLLAVTAGGADSDDIDGFGDMDALDKQYEFLREAGDRLSSQGLMGVMDGVIAPLMPTLLPDSDTVERLLTHVTQQGGDNPPKALTDIEHLWFSGKVRKLLDIVLNPRHSKSATGGPDTIDGTMVFFSRKVYAVAFHELLQHLPTSSNRGLKSAVFFGDTGQGSLSRSLNMTMNAQKRAMDAFRQGDTNLLLATHVGAEGLDFGCCSRVVLLDVPSHVVQLTQCKGRARMADSECIILLPEGSVIEERRLEKLNRQEAAMIDVIKFKTQLFIELHTRNTAADPAAMPPPPRPYHPLPATMQADVPDNTPDDEPSFTLGAVSGIGAPPARAGKPGDAAGSRALRDVRGTVVEERSVVVQPQGSVVGSVVGSVSVCGSVAGGQGAHRAAGLSGVGGGAHNQGAARPAMSEMTVEASVRGGTSPGSTEEEGEIVSPARGSNGGAAATSQDKASPLLHQQEEVFADLPPYEVPSTGARCTATMAEQVLQAYCCSLPGNDLYQLKPDFLVNEVNRYFRCTVVLPSNSRTTGATGERKSLLAEGDLCTSSGTARASAALKAVKLLHSDKLLDDYLHPADLTARLSEQRNLAALTQRLVQAEITGFVPVVKVPNKLALVFKPTFTRMKDATKANTTTTTTTTAGVSNAAGAKGTSKDKAAGLVQKRLRSPSPSTATVQAGTAAPGTQPEASVCASREGSVAPNAPTHTDTESTTHTGTTLQTATSPRMGAARARRGGPAAARGAARVAMPAKRAALAAQLTDASDTEAPSEAGDVAAAAADMAAVAADAAGVAADAAGVAAMAAEPAGAPETAGEAAAAPQQANTTTAVPMPTTPAAAANPIPDPIAAPAATAATASAAASSAITTAVPRAPSAAAAATPVAADKVTRYLYGWVVQTADLPEPAKRGPLACNIYTTEGPWPASPAWGPTAANAAAAAGSSASTAIGAATGPSELSRFGVVLTNALPSSALLPYSVWLANKGHALVAPVLLRVLQLTAAELAVLHAGHNTLCCLATVKRVKAKKKAAGSAENAADGAAPAAGAVTAAKDKLAAQPAAAGKPPAAPAAAAGPAAAVQATQQPAIQPTQPAAPDVAGPSGDAAAAAGAAAGPAAKKAADGPAKPSVYSSKSVSIEEAHHKWNSRHRVSALRAALAAAGKTLPPTLPDPAAPEACAAPAAAVPAEPWYLAVPVVLTKPRHTSKRARTGVAGADGQGTRPTASGAVDWSLLARLAAGPLPLQDLVDLGAFTLPRDVYPGTNLGAKVVTAGQGVGVGLPPAGAAGVVSQPAAAAAGGTAAQAPAAQSGTAAGPAAAAAAGIVTAAEGGSDAAAPVSQVTPEGQRVLDTVHTYMQGKLFVPSYAHDARLVYHRAAAYTLRPPAQPQPAAAAAGNAPAAASAAGTATAATPAAPATAAAGPAAVTTTAAATAEPAGVQLTLDDRVVSTAEEKEGGADGGAGGEATAVAQPSNAPNMTYRALLMKQQSWLKPELLPPHTPLVLAELGTFRQVKRDLTKPPNHKRKLRSVGGVLQQPVDKVRIKSGSGGGDGSGGKKTGQGKDNTGASKTTPAPAPVVPVAAAQTAAVPAAAAPAAPATAVAAAAEAQGPAPMDTTPQPMSAITTATNTNTDTNMATPAPTTATTTAAPATAVPDPGPPDNRRLVLPEGLKACNAEVLVPSAMLVHPLDLEEWSALVGLPAFMRRLQATVSVDEWRDVIMPHVSPNVELPVLRDLIVCLTPPRTNEAHDYEAAELIGDCVLDYLAAVHLFHALPNEHEGVLTECKVRLVANEVLLRLTTPQRDAGGAAAAADADGETASLLDAHRQRLAQSNRRVQRLEGASSRSKWSAVIPVQPYVLGKPFDATWEWLVAGDLARSAERSIKIRGKVLGDVVEALVGAAFLSRGGSQAVHMAMTLPQHEARLRAEGYAQRQEALKERIERKKAARAQSTGTATATHAAATAATDAVTAQTATTDTAAQAATQTQAQGQVQQQGVVQAGVSAGVQQGARDVDMMQGAQQVGAGVSVAGGDDVETQSVDGARESDCLAGLMVWDSERLAKAIVQTALVCQELQVLPGSFNILAAVHTSAGIAPHDPQVAEHVANAVRRAPVSAKEAAIDANLAKTLTPTLGGYSFRRPELLREALTHCSYPVPPCNQRLEYLGDAALDIVITLHLAQASSYIAMNQWDMKSVFGVHVINPGAITSRRNWLVSNKFLSILCCRCKLHHHMRIGPAAKRYIRGFEEKIDEYAKKTHEDYEEEKRREAQAIETGVAYERVKRKYGASTGAPKLLADLVEAVLGAVLIDSGGDLVAVWKVLWGLVVKADMEHYYLLK